MTTVKLNIRAIEQAAQEAFRDNCFLLGAEFTKVISEPGAFDSTPEDLIDDGDFKASQSIDPVSPVEFKFTWSVNYAIYLQNGWTTRSGKEVKGRDWVALGLERFDFDGNLAKLMAFKLKIR